MVERVTEFVAMRRFMRSRRSMVVTSSSCGQYGRKGTSLLGGQWKLVSFISSVYECVYEWAHIPLYIYIYIPNDLKL